MTSKSPLIMKFGGSSVANAERIRHVAELIKSRKKHQPVVVVSALQGITDLLIDTAKAALTQKKRLIEENLKIFQKKHQEVIEKNISKKEIPEIEKILSGYLNELKNIYHGIFCLKELSPRTLDLISTFGERISSHLLAATLRNIGQHSQRISATKLIRTDLNFGNAVVDFKTTKKLFQQKIIPLLKKNVTPIITGFFGATKNGELITLGRGGSDYSGAIAGISLNAKEIQIWTDVDGIMTTDPHIEKSASTIPSISFQEAAELAYFGAKVLHPKTIQPAIEKNIPVRILNTFNPDYPGTVITAETQNGQKTVKAIAFQKNVSVINICSSRMLGQHGFLAQTFAVFEKHEISVDVISTSEVSISLTIDDQDCTPRLIKDLERFATIRTLKDQALICVVGSGLKNDIKSESRIFQTLSSCGISTELVSKGASQINLTFVIEKKHLEMAVRSLHKNLLN